jgi:hypothetical protein
VVVAIITSFPCNTFGIFFFLPHLQRELGLTKSEMGLVWGAAILATAAFLPLVGKLLFDRQGLVARAAVRLHLLVYVFVGVSHPPPPPPFTNSLHSLLLVARVPMYVAPVPLQPGLRDAAVKPRCRNGRARRVR